LLTFETPEEEPSEEVIREDGFPKNSRRGGVSFHIDIPKANHSRVVGNEIVSIYVGPKRKKFTVHKKLICQASDFFSKGFTEGLQEAQENSMHLPEDDPNAFTLFIDWIYRSKIPERKNWKDQATLYNLYVFAEKLCLSDLANATMDEIQKLLNFLNPDLDPDFDRNSAFARKVYSETSSGSPLRKYCVQLLALDLFIESEEKMVIIDNKGLQKALAYLQR
jgi:hypothetical protein